MTTQAAPSKINDEKQRPALMGFLCLRALLSIHSFILRSIQTSIHPSIHLSMRLSIYQSSALTDIQPPN